MKQGEAHRHRERLAAAGECGEEAEGLMWSLGHRMDSQGLTFYYRELYSMFCEKP